MGKSRSGEETAMSLIETEIQGTLKPDGTLELDERPNLPAGRVKVLLRQEPEPVSDPAGGSAFWLRMQAMWAIGPKVGMLPDGGEGTLAEVCSMREEWDRHQAGLEQLQDECRQAGPSTGEQGR